MVKLLSSGQQHHQQITTIRENIVVEKAVYYGQTLAEPAHLSPEMCSIGIRDLKFRRIIR